MTKRKAIKITLIIIVVLCAAYIAWFIAKQYVIPEHDDRLLDDARKVYEIDDAHDYELPIVRFEPDINGNLVRVQSDRVNNQVDKTSLEKARKLSDNIVAWIYIDDTSIDYPVVRGNNNSYYLSHDIYGNYTDNGSIFMDYRCSEMSQNIILYGHHMNANKMFTGLMNFKSSDFLRSHKSIYFDPGDGGAKKWDVVGAFACSNADATLFLEPVFNDTVIEDFLKNVSDYRYFDTGVEFHKYDQYLTLVTCSYEANDWRTLVIAKRH